MSGSSAVGLGWPAILRAALVQTAMGAIVVLTTSTMNRIMVVELALPAMLPGALVALHYAVQMLRPRFGYGSDVGGRRTPWIIGGMAVLGLGGILASVATALLASSTLAGVALAVLAFVLIGLGVGAAGTSLLALVARSVAPSRRAPAATAMWTLMIAGFAVTAGVAGHFLDPYSPTRLVTVTSVVAIAAVLLATVAIWNVEPRQGSLPAGPAPGVVEVRTGFRAALAQVWAESEARCFTIFVFVSMLAYSAQDLILEPFAGLVFGMTPGESTQLSGLQNGGVMLGMLIVAAAAGTARGRQVMPLRNWTIGGCIASAAALLSIALAGRAGSAVALQGSVFALGLANGAFAVAAIASMMELAHRGHAQRQGVRIGLWGAAQAMAFALGGFCGAAGVDVARLLLVSPVVSYSGVFVVEALLFLLASMFAARVGRPQSERVPIDVRRFDEAALDGTGRGA